MDAKPRRWFQIHLSTAVVLMLAAGALMWLQLRGTRSYIEWDDNLEMGYERYGWPIADWPKLLYFLHADRLQTIDNRKFEYATYQAGPKDTKPYVAFTVDAITCFAILFAIGAALESIIRRREASKP